MLPMLVNHVYKILLYVSCVLCATTIHASGEPNISYLGIEHGLSNNSVTCIFQDHTGFMWFGTYDGLNRYDGYDFKVFRSRLHDTTALPNNRIAVIAEDLKKRIWIGTRSGAARYDENSIISQLPNVPAEHVSNTCGSGPWPLKSR